MDNRNDRNNQASNPALFSYDMMQCHVNFMLLHHLTCGLNASSNRSNFIALAEYDATVLFVLGTSLQRAWLIGPNDTAGKTLAPSTRWARSIAARCWSSMLVEYDNCSCCVCGPKIMDIVMRLWMTSNMIPNLKGRDLPSAATG